MDFLTAFIFLNVGLAFGYYLGKTADKPTSPKKSNWNELYPVNGRYEKLPADGDFVQVKLSNGKTARCEFFQNDDESWGFGDRFGVMDTRSRHNPRDVIAWRHA